MTTTRKSDYQLGKEQAEYDINHESLRYVACQCVAVGEAESLGACGSHYADGYCTTVRLWEQRTYSR